MESPLLLFGHFGPKPPRPAPPSWARPSQLADFPPSPSLSLAAGAHPSGLSSSSNRRPRSSLSPKPPSRSLRSHVLPLPRLGGVLKSPRAPAPLPSSFFPLSSPSFLLLREWRTVAGVVRRPREAAVPSRLCSRSSSW